MSELTITLLRLGFLLALWLGVVSVLNFMRQDLRQAERRSSRPVTVTATRPAKPTRSAKLQRLVVKDANGSTTHIIADGLLIGRNEECDVKLTDEYASGRHARLTRTEQGWLYTDLGSTNGSWREKQRILEPLLLMPGTVVRIGKSTLRFEK